MSRLMTRRQFGLAATAMALNIWPVARALRAAAGAGTEIRFATALRATFQSAAWIGTEAGIFRRHGIEVTFATLEAGGPQALAGTVRGEWDFCHTGDVPIVEGVLQGQDPVLILTPTELHEGVFVMARREITKPEQLAGARIGAVDAKGQFGRAIGPWLQQWGVSASVVSLGSFQAVYAALGAGKVDAGYLPVDLRFRGQNEFGWNVLHALPTGTGGIVTTRRFITAKRGIVAEVVKAFVDSIHLFKTQPDIIVPLLQRFLQFSDSKGLEQLYAFYVPLFRTVPRPTFFSEMQRLKDTFSKQYAAVQKLQPEDLYDSSFVDELDRSGYIQRLYSGKTN